MEGLGCGELVEDGRGGGKGSEEPETGSKQLGDRQTEGLDLITSSPLCDGGEEQGRGGERGAGRRGTWEGAWE